MEKFQKCPHNINNESDIQQLEQKYTELNAALIEF